MKSFVTSNHDALSDRLAVVCVCGTAVHSARGFWGKDIFDFCDTMLGSVL